MNNKTGKNTAMAPALAEAITQESINEIEEANSTLLKASTCKYELKEALIIEANDMTTAEKLQALDINYRLLFCEIWSVCIISGILVIGGSSLLYHCLKNDINSSRKYGPKECVT